MSKKMRFKIVGGGYVDANGKNHSKGSIVESDERLDEKFINKIVLVSELSPSSESDKQPDITTPAKKKKGKAEKTEASSSKAGKKSKEEVSEEKDVTKKFPEASEAGYRVVKIGKKYNVIDTDDNTIANEKLLKKEEISDFIQSQLDDNDDDDDEDDDDEDDEDE